MGPISLIGAELSEEFISFPSVPILSVRSELSAPKNEVLDSRAAFSRDIRGDRSPFIVPPKSEKSPSVPHFARISHFSIPVC